jgi:hypothetical protein
MEINIFVRYINDLTNGVEQGENSACREAYLICKFGEGLGKEEFNQYMRKIIDEDSQKSISLLRTYLPRFRVMGDDKYRDGDLDEKTYKYLISIPDKNYIVDAIFKVYPEAELKKLAARNKYISY